MDLLTYKILHIAGMAGVLMALGAACAAAINGLGKEKNKARSLIAMTHGISLLLIFIAGFGLLAKLGMGSPATWGLWVYAKLAIWLVMGGAIALLYKKPEFSKPVWIALPILVLIAGYLALYKPGA
jgi:hypothetical protein